MFLKIFSWIAIAEGISYLLFAVTMPLKYVWDITEPNYFVGMVHGLLFILYGFMALKAIIECNWKFKTSIIVLGAALLPGATFYVDARIIRKEIRSRQEEMA
jgi:integral membrane protein